MFVLKPASLMVRCGERDVLSQARSDVVPKEVSVPSSSVSSYR